MRVVSSGRERPKSARDVAELSTAILIWFNMDMGYFCNRLCPVYSAPAGTIS
jgi:hypothetical protein